jgi:hypothetical protein
VVGREDSVRTAPTAGLHLSIEGATPGGQATLEGGPGICGIGAEPGGWRARGLRRRGGQDQAEFCLGYCGHRWILPMDSVRG